MSEALGQTSQGYAGSSPASLAGIPREAGVMAQYAVQTQGDHMGTDARLFTDQEAIDFKKMITEVLGGKLQEASLVLRDCGLSQNPADGHWYLVCFIERMLDGRVIKLSSPFVESDLDEFVGKTYAKAIEAFYSGKTVQVVKA